MADTTLQIPIIHMNGSHGPTLREGYREVHGALRDALEKLRQTAPHGRDYYVSRDPDAFEKARTEHRAREAALVQVQKDMMALSLAVAKQEKR